MLNSNARNLTGSCLAIAGLLLGSAAAQAASDAQGSQAFNEPNGAYTLTKSYAVYAPGNPADPSPLAGNYTYVYTLSNSPGSFICIEGFDLEAPLGSITDAGALAGGGVAPSATSVGAVAGTDVVEWDFLSPKLCPADTSDELIVHSPYGPGSVSDNMVSAGGEFGLDTPGICVGPFVAPAGDPQPCTIGFWKNRAAGKKGTLQHFANGEFDSVMSAAAGLSGGLFTDESALLTSLQSKGKRSIGERANQQLAATLLNLAAGDLFPDNQKCKLFEGNQITTNACGDGISVGTAVSAAVVGAVGDTDSQHEAQECSDDINNGIGIGD